MQKLQRIVIYTIGAYLALCLLVITPLLNFLPGWYVEKEYGRSLDTGFVVLNPFKLSLDISNLALSEPDGSPFLSMGKTSVNLSSAGLWQEGWVLDEFRLEELAVNLKRLSEEQFNFSDLIPPESEDSADEEPTEVPGITIEELFLSSRIIHVADLSREKPYDSEWSGLALDVKHLSTVQEDGKPYSLRLSGPGGGTLNWQGEISIPLRQSAGKLTVEGLNLHNLWRVAEPWVAFVVDDGRLDVAGNYDVSWGDEVTYHVNDGTLRVYGLDVTPESSDTLPDTSIELEDLSVAGINVDGVKQAAGVATVAVAGLTVNGWMEDERISLTEMLTGEIAPNTADAAAAESPSTTTAESGTAEALDPNAPAAELAQDDEAGEAQTVQQSAQETPPTPTPAQTPEPATAEPASDWTATIGKFTVARSTINWRSEFTAPADMQISPIELSVQNINWPLAGDSEIAFSTQANAAASISVAGTVDAGSGNGQLTYDLQGLPLAWFNPNLPEALNAEISDGQVKVSGDVSLTEFAPGVINANAAIDGFSSAMHEAEDVLTGWKSVGVKALQVDVPGQSVEMAELRIVGYFGRLHIFKDGSINASNIMQAELEKMEDGDAQAAATEPEEPGEPWTINLKSIVLGDSQIDFMDQSLPIPFRTVIGDLNGTIRNLNTDPAVNADVKIKGSVDDYAPVNLNGTMNPLATPMGLDLNLDFNGIDMALLSPYAATYAGYKIDSGLLDVELEYALEDKALKGNNRIRMERLKLGEKIESDKAIDAPLELALSIMTDANGVIDMAVPVSGNIDNPSFQLGSVIASAFAGVLTKVITAPFSMLANLVGSSEDLHVITFPLGSATPDESSIRKLTDIAEILRQRPKIKLVLTGRLNAQADRERMQQLILKQQLLEGGLSQASIDAKDDDWENAIDKRYTKLPEAAESDASALTVQEKRAQIAKTITVSDADLQTLANERSAAVKAYLTNQEQIAPERMVIEQGSVGDKKHRYNGVELSIK